MAGWRALTAPQKRPPRALCCWRHPRTGLRPWPARPRPISSARRGASRGRAGRSSAGSRCRAQTPGGRQTDGPAERVGGAGCGEAGAAKQRRAGAWCEFK
eukprot:287334-Chlamydomonas_euryale.AAC.2